MNCSILCIKATSEKPVFLTCPQTMTSPSYHRSKHFPSDRKESFTGLFVRCLQHSQLKTAGNVSCDVLARGQGGLSASETHNSACPMCGILGHGLSQSHQSVKLSSVLLYRNHVLTGHSLCKYNLERIFFSKTKKECDCTSPVQTDERITSANKSKTQNRRFMMP